MGDRSRELRCRTRSLQPTAAVPSAFRAQARFAALLLRAGLAPRRLWLSEAVRPRHMSLRQLLREPVSTSDIFGVALMSIAAPWVAAYVHSAWVFHKGFRLYNAELGGAYFHGRPPPEPGIGTILLWFFWCAIPAMPTCLVLLPFRRRALYRWLVWCCCVAVWTVMCFLSEVAIK